MMAPRMLGGPHIKGSPSNTRRDIDGAVPPLSVGPAVTSARVRFSHNDTYRIDREWRRLEGTAQRDLFRVLRRRFLERHRGRGPWVLDAGSGPGRFTPFVGPIRSRRVAADIGPEALEQLADHWTGPPIGPAAPDRVRADLVRPPFAPESFGTVAALGNLLGFAEGQSEPLLDRLGALVVPGGTLLLEIAPAPGERSRYLGRLPAGAVARLFRAPTRAIVARVEAEGFAREIARRPKAGRFRRYSAAEIAAWCQAGHWEVVETVAVAPMLGPDAGRVDALARDPLAWARLLEVEEQVGRRKERWLRAAAVLVAARKKSEG
jgi:SAM-dependent methyltransferase